MMVRDRRWRRSSAVKDGTRTEGSPLRLVPVFVGEGLPLLLAHEKAARLPDEAEVVPIAEPVELAHRDDGLQVPGSDQPRLSAPPELPQSPEDQDVLGVPQA